MTTELIQKIKSLEGAMSKDEQRILIEICNLIKAQEDRLTRHINGGIAHQNPNIANETDKTAQNPTEIAPALPIGSQIPVARCTNCHYKSTYNGKMWCCKNAWETHPGFYCESHLTEEEFDRLTDDAITIEDGLPVMYGKKCRVYVDGPSGGSIEKEMAIWIFGRYDGGKVATPNGSVDVADYIVRFADFDPIDVDSNKFKSLK